jgi:diguanylate cyclase (GGDEF)-like protein
VLALPDDNIAVTVSIGVSTASVENTLGDMLNEADGALYEAKGSGRNRVCSHASKMAPEAIS